MTFSPEAKKRVQDSFRRSQLRKRVWLADVDVDALAARLELAITLGEIGEALASLTWVEYGALANSRYSERIRILPGEGPYKHLHFQGYVVHVPQGSPPWMEE